MKRGMVGNAYDVISKGQFCEIYPNEIIILSCLPESRSQPLDRETILALTQFAVLNSLRIFRRLDNSVFLFWNSDDEGRKEKIIQKIFCTGLPDSSVNSKC